LQPVGGGAFQGILTEFYMTFLHQSHSIVIIAIVVVFELIKCLAFLAMPAKG
jgi:hypothetical protein